MVSVNIKHFHSNRLTVDMGSIVSAGMSMLTFLMFSVCKCVRVFIEVRCDNLQPLTSICFSFTVPFSSLKTDIRYNKYPSGHFLFQHWVTDEQWWFNSYWWGELMQTIKMSFLFYAKHLQPCLSMCLCCITQGNRDKFGVTNIPHCDISPYILYMISRIRPQGI